MSDTPQTEPVKRGRAKKPEIESALDIDHLLNAPKAENAPNSLRQMMKLLPKPGLPMKVVIDGETIELYPGDWAARLNDFGDPIYMDDRTGLPKNCPVEPLGKLPNNGGFAFLDPIGSVFILKPGAGKGDIAALFAPFTAYLLWAWPRKHVGQSKREEKDVVDNFHAELARDALFDAAGVYKTFDPNGIVRGRGCWRDDDGSLVFHAGDAVLINGKWKRPGRIGEYIYPAKRAIGRPLAVKDSWEAAQSMLEVLRTFNWERPGVDPELKLGWMAMARLGAALKERSSVWVTAQEGSGKSLLFEIETAFMGKAIVTAAEASAAMIYQTLREDVVPVILDEQEAEVDNRHVYNIVKLARISFSGGVLGRGGDGGVPVGYQLRSAFFFSSIVQPSIKSQDESRMINLMLAPQRAEQKSKKPDMGDVERWGAIIMQRMIDGFDRLDDLIGEIHAYLRANGYDPRGADTLSPIIACHHLACYDTDIDAEALAEWVRKVPPPVKTVTWQRMVAFMMETRPEEFRDPKTKDKSLEAIIMSLRDEMKSGEPHLVKDALDAANVKVRPFGMFFDFDPEVSGSLSFDDVELFIPNGHAGMVSLMSGSDWGGRVGATGPWHGVLKQAAMQGVARSSGKPVKKNNVVAVRGHFLHLGRAMKSFE